MLISVIIPNHNYGHYLVQTVSSVLSQTYSALECIIVDDGSTDNSKQIIEQLAAQDPRVKPLFKSNKGLSSARNTGLNAANGEWVAYLDADDYWEKNKLQNQVNYIKNNPGTDFVFSNYIGFYPDGKEEIFNHTFGNVSLFDFINQNPVAGSASSAIHKRILHLKAGAFNETLTSSEDLEYWYRCMLHGAVFGYCNTTDVKIRLHYQSMSQNHSRMALNNFAVLKYITCTFPVQHSNKKKFWDHVFKKLQSILWYARDARNMRLVWHTYAFALQYAFQNSNALRYLLRNVKYDAWFSIGLIIGKIQAKCV